MEATMEIRHYEGAASPSSGLDKPTRDAWAAYATTRWPTHTAKMVAKEWGLSLDEAKGLIAGRTSLATLDRIHKHKNGGWAVLLPVMGAVIGQGVDDFLEQEARRLAHARDEYEARERRLGEMARDMRALFGLGVGRPSELPSGRPGEGRSVDG